MKSSPFKHKVLSSRSVRALSTAAAVYGFFRAGRAEVSFIGGQLPRQFSGGSALLCAAGLNDRQLSSTYLRPRARSVKSGLPALASDLQDLTSLEEGRWLPARVRHGQASYGVWVDVHPDDSEEAILGLIHISEMGEVQTVEPGQEFWVRVAHVDADRGHVGLSLLGDIPAGPPFLSTASSPLRSERSGRQDVSAFSSIFASEWLDGRVVQGSRNSASTGVFVDVTSPTGLVARGLVPFSRINGISSFQDGQQVHVRVLGVTSDAQLDLSMLGDAQHIQADLEAQLRALENSQTTDKSLPDDQDVSAFLDLPTSQWLDGVVHHQASYGVYVTIAPPKSRGSSAWGLVHLSELDPSMTFEPGMAVHVRVLELNTDVGRIRLSMLPSDESVEGASVSSSEAKQKSSLPDASTWLRGVVAKVLDYGLLVDLENGAQGLVYETEMEDFNVQRFVKGEEVRVRAIDDWQEDGHCMLSMLSDPVDIEADVTAQRETARLRDELTELNEDDTHTPTAQDIELRVMRDQLRTFLGVSPNDWLSGLVQHGTPFGVLVHVEHPDGEIAVRGLLPLEEASELRFGDVVSVRVASVDTHRGVLALTTLD